MRHRRGEDARAVREHRAVEGRHGVMLAARERLAGDPNRDYGAVVATAARHSPMRWVATRLAVVGAALCAEPAWAGGFDCMRSIGARRPRPWACPRRWWRAAAASTTAASTRAATSTSSSPGTSSSGRSSTECGARLVPADVPRRTARSSSTRSAAWPGSAGLRSHSRRAASSRPPASPIVTRSVFVYRNGRMLRPITTEGGPGKLASVAQLVRLARAANRGL